jgi:hypothetical protein
MEVLSVLVELLLLVCEVVDGGVGGSCALLIWQANTMYIIVINKFFICSLFNDF